MNPSASVFVLTPPDKCKHRKPPPKTGDRFNNLVVVKYIGKVNGRPFCEFLCDCGKLKTTCFSDVKSGHTKSCGCQVSIKAKIHKTSHGMRRTPEYAAWTQIKNRCYNKNASNYDDYGGRGITVCNEWIESFENFYKDLGPRPTKLHSIDRINNNFGYSKDNCRWATELEQQNNKRSNVVYMVAGKEMSLSQASRVFGLNPKTVSTRKCNGWPDWLLFSSKNSKKPKAT